MAMINLFKKISTIGTTAIAVFCSFACSDKVAGTAEEPNQFAYGNSSSSEEIDAPNDNPSPSSSSGFPVPITQSSSSTKEGNGTLDPIPITFSSSSALDSANGRGGLGHDGQTGTCTSADGQTNLCNETETSKRSLEDYLKMYGVTEAVFDTSVLAYNKTFISSRDTAENANIAELRTLGLHKITNENAVGLTHLFYETTWFMGGKVYGKDGSVSFQTDGCPLYILNIVDTSPAIHVLTSITKDTITIADFYDNCDYERRPFDMHVGYLFEYCGELSESPKIERTFTLKESMKCGSVEYDEFINKKPTIRQ